MLSTETLIVKNTICHDSAVTRLFYFVTMKPNFSNTVRACGPARYAANFFARSGSLEFFRTASG